MSKSLTVSHNRMITSKLQQQLACHVKGMDDTVKLARLALEEIKSLNRYTAGIGTATLERALQNVETAQRRGRLTSEQRQEFENLTWAYIAELARIVNVAGEDIAQIVGYSSSSVLRLRG